MLTSQQKHKTWQNDDKTKVTIEDTASVAKQEEKIIKKLREQQHHKQQKHKNQKTFYNCLNKLRSKSFATTKPASQHERLHEVHEEVSFFN
jgi:hypothetical protein